MNVCVSCAFVGFSLTMPNNFDTLRPNENKNILINLMYSFHQLQQELREEMKMSIAVILNFVRNFFVVFIVSVQLERDHSFCLSFEFRSG